MFIVFSILSISLSSLLASLRSIFSRITFLIVNCHVLGFPCSSIVFVCFSKTFPKGQ